MAEQQLSKQTKMAMTSQFLGFMLDAYDMAMVIVMAPILGKIFISPKGSVLWQYIAVVLGYSITMAARPVGSAFFGAYADKIGRRFLLIFTIAGVGVMSVLSGFLPTYAQVGVTALRSCIACCVSSWAASSAASTPWATPSPSNMPRRRRAARSADLFSPASPWATCWRRWSLPRFHTSAAKPSWRSMAGASLL